MPDFSFVSATCSFAVDPAVGAVRLDPGSAYSSPMSQKKVSDASSCFSGGRATAQKAEDDLSRYLLHE